MPKKLISCVKQVQTKSKGKADAWAICVKSTGLKPHRSK